MDFTAVDLETLRSERNQLLAELAEKDRQLALVERNLQRAVAESYTLYMTGLDVTGQLDLPNTLQSILRRLRALIQADASLIYLHDSATGELTIAAASNAPAGVVGTRIQPTNSPFGEVQQFGVPTVLDDYHAWAIPLHGTAEMAYYGTALLPLRWQGSVIGVIALHYLTAGRTFNLDDLDSLQHVAVQAAIAIYNATQFAAEQSRSRQLATLFQAATYVTGSLEAATVLKSATEAIIEVLRAAHCRLYEYRPSSGFRVLAQHNPLPEIGHANPPQLLPKAILGMAEEGHWVVIQRADPFIQPLAAAYLDRQRAHSVLLVPIRLPEEVLGIVEVLETNAPRQFSLADINAVQALAAHTSTALGHARLHAEVRAQRVQEQAVLFQLAQRLLEAHDVKQVGQRASEVVAEAFRSRYAGMMMTRDEGLEATAVVGEVLEPSRGLWFPFAESRTSGMYYAMHSEDMVILDDCRTEKRFATVQQFIDAGMRSALIAPIKYNDRIFGVVFVARTEPFGFSEDDVRLFRLMIYQIAVALERASLFESVQAQNLELEARVADRTREILMEKDRTETILEAVGESIIVFDRAGRILQVNRAFEAHHGLKQREVVGRTSEDILKVDLFNAAAFQATPEFAVWRGELRLPLPDGETYDAAVTLSPLLDEGGGAVASLRDITYLRELDRMKTTFVSNVSHELRTPLANMKLYLHLLNKGLESRRPHYIATLQREMERLQTLIEDLLLLSRLDQNRTVPTMESVPINDLIGTLVEDRRYLAQERGLEMSYAPAPHEIVVQADPKLLTQAVGNLIANAMNYTPKGGQIWVQTRSQSLAGGECVVISVSDSGLGMSEDDQARLFDRFFRGEAARATGAAGTGLGMAIVQEIMVKHGGSVTVQSKLGEGSIFQLQIPTNS